ncbi:SSI family serine proteinase inhibitor [Nonomuraea africana]|uniref:Subtilisin inhibitor domain-containing protein n=1 Tax=Nonomuraea africana TaxID=46171 RepID=A0ABR9KKU3_9ACTN|nr:SSI family serine proteinase inhibitor [Nonomuraea africana]MBE1562625.1 hypothetical protein [Nonomuraea africana]
MTSLKIVALVAAALLSTSAASCPSTSLRVEVTVAEGVPATAELRCGPAGGTHPSAVAACALLDTVNGDLSRHPGERGICTREYRPHTVRLSGTWDGRTVSYVRTYGNRCMMLLATGAVFAL